MPFQKGNTLSQGRKKGTKNKRTLMQEKLDTISKRAIDKCHRRGDMTAYEFLSTIIQDDGYITIACVNVDKPNTVEMRQIQAGVQQKMDAAKALAPYQTRKMPNAVEMDEETANAVGAGYAAAMVKYSEFFGEDEEQAE